MINHNISYRILFLGHPENGGNILFNFIHLVDCLMTGRKHLPKRAPQTVPARASSFKRDYPLLSL